MVHPLQAEQQLGFPAGATAGASSLDTAAPTVSLLHSSIFTLFLFTCCLVFFFIFHLFLSIAHCQCPPYLSLHHIPSLTSQQHPPHIFHLVLFNLATQLSFILSLLQVPCIPNPEAEAEAGGSSDDKDGQDGRKKKNRYSVSPSYSIV